MTQTQEVKVNPLSPPVVQCPDCGREFHGWALTEYLKKGETITCDCGAELKLVE